MSAQSIAPGLPTAIGSFLASTRRRLRLQAAARGAAFGLGVGLGIAVALGVATRLQPFLLPDQLLLTALAALAACTAVGAAFMTTRPLPLHVVAAHADRELDLRERLSTALELSEGTTHSTLASLHLAETAQVVAGRRDERIAWPRPSRELATTLAVLAVALLALLILPNAQTTVIQQRQANQQIVQQAAQQVAQVQAQVNGRTDLDPATKQALQQQLNQLQQDLANGTTDPLQAVARIAETEAQLRRLQDPTAVSRGAGLPQLGDEFGTFGATAPIGQKLREGDYAGASQALKDFAGQLPSLDPASQAAIAQKLREAAASQAATDPKLAQQLQQAADLLDQGDVAGAQAALNAAADQLNQTGQALAAQQSLSGVLGDLNAIKRDVANGVPPTTANATPQLASGTPVALNGTPVPYNGTPFTLSGTPITISGTPGQTNANGTPVAVQGTLPPNATIVVGQGQGQGQNQGQGQQGQGQGQQGQGQGQPGQGQGQGQGQNQGQGGNTGTGGGQGAGTGGISNYDPVYAPTLPGGPPGQQQGVSGSGGTGGQPVGTTQGQGVNAPSTVPYDQVYQQYRDQALQGIDDPTIPPELRDYIRQYFSNIDPNKK